MVHFCQVWLLWPRPHEEVWMLPKEEGGEVFQRWAWPDSRLRRWGDPPGGLQRLLQRWGAGPECLHGHGCWCPLLNLPEILPICAGTYELTKIFERDFSFIEMRWVWIVIYSNYPSTWTERHRGSWLHCLLLLWNMTFIRKIRILFEKKYFSNILYILIIDFI